MPRIRPEILLEQLEGIFTTLILCESLSRNYELCGHLEALRGRVERLIESVLYLIPPDSPTVRGGAGE